MIAPAESPLLLDYFHAEYVKDHLSLDRKSAEQIEVSLRLLDRWHGSPVRLRDLEKPLFRDWLYWLKTAEPRSRAPATVNSKRGALLAVWNHAADAELVDRPPRIKRLRVPDRMPVAWTLSEIERIFDSLATLRGNWEGVPIGLCWTIGVLVFWDTGCRLGTLLSARLANVNLSAGTLFVPAEAIKGKRADRLFALHGQTLAAIEASLPSRRERLFPFPCRPRQIWDHWRRILRAAGLPTDRSRMFHCLRRSAESHAAAKTTIAWAAEAIGHTVEVARRSYISPLIAPGPKLIEVLPRPRIGRRKECAGQMELFGNDEG